MIQQPHSWAYIWRKLQSEKLHLNVHCSSTDNSQDMEATQKSINRCMDKMWCVYVYTHKPHTHHKKETMPFSVTWIALEIITLSKLDRERQMSGYCLYVGEKKIQRSLFTNTQQTNLQLPKGQVGVVEINQEFDMKIYTYYI